MKVISNALLNATRSMVGLAIGVATTIIVARTLGPDSYGGYSYLNWLTLTLTVLLGLGFPMALVKLVSEARGRSSQPHVRGLLRVALWRAGGASVAAIAAIIVVALTLPLPFKSLHLVLAALTVIPSVLAACYGSAINGLEAYGPTTRVSIVVAVLQFGLSLIVLALGGRVGALVSVWVIGAAVSLVWLRSIARRLGGDGSSPAPPEMRAGMVRYARDMVPIILLDLVVWKRSELFFLERFWDMRTVGLYSVAFGIAEKAMRLPQSLYGILTPTFSNLSAARDGATVELLFQTATRLVGIIIIPIGLIAAIVAQPLVQIVYGPAYAAAAGPFAVLILFNVVGAMTGVAVMALYGMGEQRVVLMKDAAGAAVNLLLNLTLTSAWGLWGAVVANSAAQLVSCIILWCQVSRKFDLMPLSGMLLRVLVPSVVAAAAARLLVNIVPGAVGLVSGLLLAGAVYGGGVLLTGALGRQDWRALAVKSV